MNKIVLGILVAAGMLVALMLFFFDPTTVPVYPVCPFHELTGLDCPGCGSTRALHALLHGRLSAALHFNAMLILSLPLFAGLGLRYVLARIHNKPVAPLQSQWIWLYLAAWIGFSVLRNLPIQPFASFAP